MLQSKTNASSLVLTSEKEVMYSSALVSLFVCLQNYAKSTQQIFTKFGEKVGHGPQKKPICFGGNLDHVKLGLR